MLATSSLIDHNAISFLLSRKLLINGMTLVSLVLYTCTIVRCRCSGYFINLPVI